MAPKICYDAADMQQKAEKSLEQEIRNAWKEGVSLPSSAEFTCEYLGVLTDDGFKLEARPTLRSTVGHKWSYRDNTVNVSQTKKARYDYSVEHGTSMPEQWKTALKCRRLSVIARESAALFEEHSGLRDVTCRVIGLPRPVTIHLDGRIELGSILKLAMGIAPVEYVLCAHVEGQTWLCHRGSFEGNALSRTPFDESDLAVKVLTADLWVEGMERPRKRVRTHLRMGMLAEEIRKHGAAFNHLVARALWKAEEIRAGDGPMDEGLALAGYEANPFSWTGGLRAEVGFLWTVPSGDGICKQVSTTRMDRLLSTAHGRCVTFPSIGPQNHWKYFKELAANEMTLRCEHCVYLGINVARDRFEEDPSKWHRSAGGTKATVYFEWPGVLTKGGTVYRSSSSVCDLVHHSRRPPKGPLSSTAPSNLTFK